MVAVSRLVVQLLCLLSYLWTSTCLGNVLLINQLVQQDPYPNIIMIDEASDLLTVHHKGHRDQHEPQAKDERQAGSEHEHGDHVVKIVCVDHQPSGLTPNHSLTRFKLPMFSGLIFVNEVFIKQAVAKLVKKLGLAVFVDTFKFGVF